MKAPMKNVCKLTLFLPALVLHAQDGGIQVRALHLALEAMPPARDLSTPEGAYTAVIRVLLEGGELSPLFAKALQERVPKGVIKPRSEKTQALLRPLRLEEVHQLGDGAAVVATLGDGQLTVRYLEFEEGRWASLGEDEAGSLEKGRKLAARFLSGKVKAVRQAPAAQPDAKLATFVKHLRTCGAEPKELLLEAMASHRLTALGEIHARPLSWAAYTRLVQDPRFAQRVGTLYLELPRNGQGLMDRFLASDTLDPEPVVEILRDVQHAGMPDQALVGFLCELWKVNRALPPEGRLRVRLVDQDWNWREIRTKEDAPRLTQDRDPLMAQAILEDLAGPAGARNAVFLVGYLHLPGKLAPKLDPASPIQNAGTLLRERLGAGLFTVLQHGPVLTNRGGEVHGRVRGGLFDEAFARLGNRPVAFPLAGSPFGLEPFDSSWDLRNCQGTYGGAFDAYLYLGPLEGETFSPIIPGFYTEAYAREVERRCRLVYAEGIKDVEDLKGSDAAALTEGALRLWGRPRTWAAGLGPMEAWRR
jgi:hypothetical protein